MPRCAPRTRAFPAWRALPVAERARLLRKVGDLMEERVYDIAAALTLEVGKNRMEALGEAQETVDFFHYYADDFERNAGFDRPLPERSARRHGLAQSQRDAAARRVGGDRAVQFPVRAGRRAGRGGAGHRQHGGGQGRQRHAVVRPPARRLHPRCRPAAGRLQLRVRLRPRSRRGAGAASAHRRHHLHRLGRRRHAAAAADGQRRLPAAVHRRDGRQESVHRHRARRPGARRHRHRPLRLRHGRAEVLGAVAPVRARTRRRCADRSAARRRSRRSASAMHASARTGWAR